MTLIPIPNELTEDEAKVALDAMIALKSANQAAIPGFLLLAQSVGQREGARAAVSMLVESGLIPAGMHKAMTDAALETLAKGKAL